MTLKQIEAFYWAAKLGTFAIAAERLHITQSSLSKRIAELESSLGKELFDRSVKRGALTTAGKALLDYAGRMLELTHAMRSGVAEESVFSGSCRVGVSELSATTWFPAFVHAVHTDHPDLLLKPRVGLGRALVRLVERGELDFAIIAGVGTGEASDSVIISEVEFAWMDSPRAQDTLSVRPVILSTEDSSINIMLKNWAASEGIRLDHTINCNSMMVTVGLTVGGVGLSCLPRAYVSRLIERNLLTPVSAAASRHRTLPFSFVSRQDDRRRLVREMKERVFEQADFCMPNPLWS